MSKNKIVLFSNMKGGVGKTTLCCCMANYLSIDKDEKVLVLDADLQQSLFRHRQRELAANPDMPIPWNIYPIDTTDKYDNDGKLIKTGLQNVSALMAKLKTVQGIVLIDCPGSMDVPALKPIFMAADVLIVPIRYDEDTVDATGIFVKTVREICNPKIYFIPNRIVVTEERKDYILKQRDETKEILGKVGFVTPRIKQSVSVQRYSTLILPHAERRYSILATMNAFDSIIDYWNYEKDAKKRIGQSLG